MSRTCPFEMPCSIGSPGAAVSGWADTLAAASDGRVAILLFGEDVTRKYTAAIEARGIPHLLVGGKSFHDREEVETLRTALAAIEWPDDELSVFGTLHGALFAVDDETLFEYRHRYGRFHPFALPPEPVPEALAPVVDALDRKSTRLNSSHRT